MAAWIRLIGRNEATGKLKEVYEKRPPAEGDECPPIVLSGCWNPGALEGRTDLFKALMYGRSSKLTRAEREMIALVTSSVNQCHY